MKTVQINSAVWKEGDYFVAQCLNVEVSSFGDTRDEALVNLKEAIDLYLEDNDDPHFTIIDSPEIVASVLKYA